MWIDIIFLWIVIATYKEFAQHPIVWPSGNSTPHPLFLCPNLNGRRIKDVWFTTSPIGHNLLRLIVEHLIFYFLALKEKNLSNKMERGVGII